MCVCVDVCGYVFFAVVCLLYPCWPSRVFVGLMPDSFLFVSLMPSDGCSDEAMALTVSNAEAASSRAALETDKAMALTLLNAAAAFAEAGAATEKASLLSAQEKGTRCNGLCCRSVSE